MNLLVIIALVGALTGAEQQRASQTIYDTAERVVESKFGEGAGRPPT